MLKLLFIFFCLFTNNTLNFVTSLLFSNNYNVILIVIDYSNTKSHHIPYTINENRNIIKTTNQ